MSELLVVWVGRRPSPAVHEIAGDFARRIERLARLEEVRVPPAAGRALDPARALALEAAAIRRHLGPRDHVVALAERGSERTSEELAAWLAERGRTARLAFLLGSDLGLDDALLRSAHERLALSRLTLPHQLARVVLLEQLYRALDILAGGPYHRGERTSHV